MMSCFMFFFALLCLKKQLNTCRHCMSENVTSVIYWHAILLSLFEMLSCRVSMLHSILQQSASISSWRIHTTKGFRPLNK